MRRYVKALVRAGKAIVEMATMLGSLTQCALSIYALLLLVHMYLH